MGKNWAERKTMLLIIIVTVASFFAWIGLLLLVWLALRARGIPADFWAMAESLSTVLAAAAVITAGFIAYRELSEISNSRNLEIIDRLFAELNSAENIEARRWIYQNLPEDPAVGLAIMTGEGRAALKRVLNSLDRVAFLTQPGWIDEEKVMPWMNPMIVKAWLKLCPFVLFERERRQEPDYYRTAEQLAERCLVWRAAHYPKAQTTWVDNAL
jgi:hypothetical protein